jgi:uncharacterized protein YndB with AHSA1/START domain
MATRVEKTVVVDVPVQTAYAQWTQFEEFPQFMGGISEVRQLDDTTLHWVAEIGGVRRQWQARILEQVPDTKVSWAATEGATNAGAVSFAPAGPGQTTVRLELEYEPEGVVETVADKIGVVGRRAEADLEKFKSFIEERGRASGAWTGTVPGTGGTPGVEAAGASRGDSGGAGVSAGKVAAGVAGVAAAAAGVAAAAKAASGGSEEERPDTTLADAPGTTTAPGTAGTTQVPASAGDAAPLDATTSEVIAPASPESDTDVERDPRI